MLIWRLQFPPDKLGVRLGSWQWRLPSAQEQSPCGVSQLQWSTHSPPGSQRSTRSDPGATQVCWSAGIMQGQPAVTARVLVRLSGQTLLRKLWSEGSGWEHWVCPQQEAEGRQSALQELLLTLDTAELSRRRREQAGTLILQWLAGLYCHLGLYIIASLLSCRLSLHSYLCFVPCSGGIQRQPVLFFILFLFDVCPVTHLRRLMTNK